VLVIDDAESDRELIQHYLADDHDQPSEVVFAGTVEDGVALAQASHFDLALVDWSLPCASGGDIGTLLQAAGVKLPFVLMTNQARTDQVADAFRRGAVDFLVKSDLSPNVLARVCEHAIVRARLGRDLDRARCAELTASMAEREARAAAERALAEQAQLTERVSRLYLLSSVFSAAVTTQEVARALVAHAAVFGRPTAASFHVLRVDRLILQESQGFQRIDNWGTLSLSKNSPLTEAVRSGEVVRVASSEEMEQNYGVSMRDDGVAQEWVAVPVRNDEEVLGVIGLRFVRGQQPLGEEIDFVRLVAQLAAQAMVRARLYEVASRSADHERRLLAIVGHDLRTPLSALVTGTQLLSCKYPEEPVVQRLLRSATRMGELVEDIMARSEAFSGSTARDEVEATDLAEVVQEAAEELSAAFSGSHIAVTSAGPIHTKLNGTRVRQAVANLVRNALQYGAQGRPVTIALCAVGSDQISLSVHNEGGSIPPELVPMLFEPFRRGCDAPGRGAGLGLYIVKELAMSMGGSVSVSSGVSGTTFKLLLPRGSRSSQIVPPPAARDPARAGA
jgi:signal transduction histidine kinase